MNNFFIHFFNFLLFLGILQTINSQIIFPSDDDEQTIDTSSRVTQTYGPCNTPNRRRGTCVKIRECRNLWQLIEKQVSYQLTYTELTFLRNSQCGEQDGILVCCEPSQVDNTAPAPAPAVRPPARRPTTAPARRPQISSLLPSGNQCASTGERIYGGKETELGEFPWMALIEYTKNNGKKSHHCSGCLISNRYILTAAHCITGKIPDKYTLSGVRLGEWDKSMDPDCEEDLNYNKACADPHVDISIEKTIAHPNYNSSSLNQYNDIALIRLSRNVEYTKWIVPLCLPTDENLRNKIYFNQTLIISGWGKTETSKSSNKQLKAYVKIVSRDTCNFKYNDFNITVTDNQLCAGGVEGTDTCNGDSGGPLISFNQLKENSHYFIAGIVSYGPSPCALENWAGVYTKVANYIDWILSNIEP